MLPTRPLLNATAPAGPHLPVALLRQYAAGALAPAAQHRVEAHTLACPRCADILAGLLQTPPATTDQALAQLQQRLRRRTQPAPAARPVLAGQHRRWLAPQLAAALALLLGLVASGWWAWQQRHPATPLASVATVPPTKAPVVVPPPASVAPPATLAAPAPATKPLATASVARRPRARPAARPTPPAPTPAPAAELAASQPVAAVPATRPLAAPVAAVSPPSSADTRVADSAYQTGRVAMAKRAAETAVAQERAMPSAPPVAATPVGGPAALREHLRRGAGKFVPDADTKPLVGEVRLRATVGPDGKLGTIKVLVGLRDDYDEEAERLLREGPTWVPAIRNGQRIAQQVTVSVVF